MVRAAASGSAPLLVSASVPPLTVVAPVNEFAVVSVRFHAPELVKPVLPAMPPLPLKV